ncbi:MAG: hypothetical protein AVDCRST_MAG75-2616 [uncultured Propionibacteriaceae bacterium]|uniref:Uncharacterized protein n=1 Tax=uncultured Propionibacteriaceae bacterium TaxID=257457 RepID=A0A6J4PFZ7_9ACTN|nr:MAG: hypothetical protein AVDCRST_MAG75-2616 [uncultured Propionibacteriaceae bacterium]
MASLWVIEGIGTYGAGLARAAAQGGYPVVEAARMNARGHRGIGKSDPLDAQRTAPPCCRWTSPSSATHAVTRARVLRCASWSLPATT